MTTQSTTQCNPGDVILVPFKFADKDSAKPRPAIIVSVQQYHDARADSVMLAVTSRQGRSYFRDCEIREWRAAGLVAPSTAKGVLRTINRSLIYRKLGTLAQRDYERVKDSLRVIFGL